LNIAVFASGRGSNLNAILEAVNAGKIPNSRIAVVISNNSDSGALEIARKNNLPALHCSRKQFTSDDEFTTFLLSALRSHDVNFIALAGYMKKVDTRIIREFRNRILNIHPALLPAFGGKGMYGIHVHEAVLESHQTVSGATVHLVDEDYDHGPIVLQKRVNINPTDTPESLAERILNIEHELYPEAIRLFAEGKVIVDGRHMTVTIAS
jgi:phosphoribosylglycinamide formyltransferase-1